MTERRERRGITPALIIVPSLVSGVGLILVLVAILLNNEILRDIFLAVGLALLWADFFVTMAIFRYSIRNIDERLRRMEERAGRN